MIGNAALDIAVGAIVLDVELGLEHRHLGIALGERLGTVLVADGLRALPVGAGKNGRLLVHVVGARLELVGGGDIVGRRVDRRLAGLGVELGLALLVRGTNVVGIGPVEEGRLGDGRRTRVDHIVAVGAQGHLVVARLEQVAARRPVAVVVGIVIGGHVLLVEGQGHGLRLARFEQTRLGEVREDADGLLDLVVAIVVRVGALVVDLHNVLAGDVASVGYRHVHRDSFARIIVRASLLREGCVGQAVAKGVGHCTSLSDTALAVKRAISEGVVLDIGRLVIAVAHIDALLVLQVGTGDRALHAAHEAGHREVGVVVAEVADVDIAGVGREVGRPDVHGTAGGVDLAVHDMSQLGET